MNTNRVYVLHKTVGETPLQALARSREEEGLPEHVPMAYAGRLDPMAEGKLLVLTGDACKEINSYYNLDKEYAVSVVLGLCSDSHDVLGRLTYEEGVQTFPKEYLKMNLKEFVGHYSWPYPAISSKPVNGKPLFQWFLEDRLDEIEIPQSTGKIYTLELTGLRTITPEELKQRTLEKIHSLAIVTDESKRLGRDFRRHEVVDSWNTWYKTVSHAVPYRELHTPLLQILEITCTASAGTYMRTLAHEIGRKLGVGGLALEIRRTKIGAYVQAGPLSFWFKQY
jgi:tRNA pseudouridine55 synthase